MGQLSRIGSFLQNFDPFEDRYISREFQKYGYELARELGDLGRKSLYIKLAKTAPRRFLEEAKNYVKEAVSAGKKIKNPGGLFMWKLKELEKMKREKDYGGQNQKPGNTGQ